MSATPAPPFLSQVLDSMSEFASVADVPAAYVGTYKGAGYMAKYLKALGYNTIELLPVQETKNDVNSDTSPAGNYWGYMTYGYFAPDRRYSSDKTPGGPTKQSTCPLRDSFSLNRWTARNSRMRSFTSSRP